MLNAYFDCSIDGSAVMFLATVPEGRIVVVHGYAGCGDEEEVGTSFVCGFEGGGVVEVGVAEGDGLVAKVFELGGGGI